MTGRVAIYVQHLMGIGHVTRAAAIASALTDRGVAVLFIMGGAPLENINCGSAEIVYLPAAKAADATATGIVALDGSELTDVWYADRKARLLGLIAEFQPDILITEQYPFGRRAFEFELLPLLRSAKTDGVSIVCSVRDILVAKDKASRNEAMADVAREFFDLVLVHGDENQIPFEYSFPLTERIRDLIEYTGYVVNRNDRESDDGHGEVIVSAGGGRYGDSIYKTALAARPLSSLSDVPWRFLVGSNAESSLYSELEALADDGVVIEPARDDFPGMLKNARLSISQSGYNTVLDVLAACVPNVLIPFSGNNDTEQAQRARYLAAENSAIYLDEKELTPQSLCGAIECALRLKPEEMPIPNMHGADKSAEILCALLDNR